MMTKKKKITIGIIVIVAIIAGVILYFSISDRDESDLEHNVKKIIEDVGIDGAPARYLAEQLEKLDLGKIKHLDVTRQRTYIEVIMTNDNDEEYLLSLKLGGGVFAIKENKPDGEFLFAILE